MANRLTTLFVWLSVLLGQALVWWTPEKWSGVDGYLLATFLCTMGAMLVVACIMPIVIPLAIALRLR